MDFHTRAWRFPRTISHERGGLTLAPFTPSSSATAPPSYHEGNWQNYPPWDEFGSLGPNNWAEGECSIELPATGDMPVLGVGFGVHVDEENGPWALATKMIVGLYVQMTSSE